MAAVPLERVLGPELGAIYRDVHTRPRRRAARRDAASRPSRAPAQRRARCALADGRTIDCDFVVVGVGVAPRTELAEDAGLDVDNGVLVDERLETERRRASSPPATSPTPATPSSASSIRVEHWANALNQGPAAAAQRCSARTRAYDRLPYFFSDQYDVGMEYAGYATDWDEVVFRGDLDAREFIAFWLPRRPRRSPA